MKMYQNDNWLSPYVHTYIEPLPIPLIKVELEEEHVSNIIKVKMWRNPTPDTSDTYNINMSTFEDGQPEEFLALLNNFRNAIYGTGTTSPSVQMNYLRMMLRGEDLR